MSKTALIIAVTGRDGAYQAEPLMVKGCSVHGIKRRASLFNIAHCLSHGVSCTSQAVAGHQDHSAHVE